jgi:hypothetical protein
VSANRTMVAVLGLASVFSFHPVFGCTRVVGPPTKVKATFVVFVHDPSGEPLPGAEIRVYQVTPKPPYEELVRSSITGKDGKAEITGLHDNYSLEAKIGGASSQIAQIDIYEDGSGTSEVGLTWPGGPITPIQNVSGILGEGSSKVPWVGALVELKGPTGKVGKKVTDSHGRFDFDGIAPGFYALHVKDPGAATGPARVPQLEGDVAIEVRKDAANVELPLWGFVASSCGLSAYTLSNSMIIFEP